MYNFSVLLVALSENMSKFASRRCGCSNLSKITERPKYDIPRCVVLARNVPSATCHTSYVMILLRDICVTCADSRRIGAHRHRFAATSWQSVHS
jgi:hypothetical protein